MHQTTKIPKWDKLSKPEALDGVRSATIFTLLPTNTSPTECYYEPYNFYIAPRDLLRLPQATIPCLALHLAFVNFLLQYFLYKHIKILTCAI